jgi:trigger factor
LEITLNKKNNTEGLIKIKLTEGDYQPHVEEKLKDYARKATIKGFRAGKVPQGVIKKMFGKSILVEEINHLLSHKLSDYIKDNNIKILGEPLPNADASQSIDWETQKDFEFEYQIGMVDDFKYELSTKVKVKSHPIEVDQKMIDETIDDLKKRFGKVSYPEASSEGDNLFGALRAAEGEWKKEAAFIPLEKVERKELKKFVGLKKDDEVEFDLKKAFANQETIETILGVPAEDAKSASGNYFFKVETVSHVEPAALDQELFDRVFGMGTATTQEEFLNKVKETIGENYKRESDHFLEHNIEDYFIKNTTIDLPVAFLRSWLKATSKGEVTDSVLDNEFDSYSRSIKWDLVKNRIADDNKIAVVADEVRQKAKDMIVAQFGGQAFAAQLQDKLDGIADNYLQNENGQNFMKLYNQIRNEKILKHIKENITIQENKVSVDEFKKIVEEHKH